MDSWLFRCWMRTLRYETCTMSRLQHVCFVLGCCFAFVACGEGRIYKTYLNTAEQVDYNGAVLKITTILMEPYVMTSPNLTSPDPTPRYHGYLVDLLDHIGSMLGFHYELHLVPDGLYGHQISGTLGKWSGMVGEILEQKADLAAAPLYVTHRRRHVIDFTDPFMDVYTSILVQKRVDGSHVYLKTPRDVILQDHVTLGTLHRGVIYRAMRKSNDSLSHRMKELMQRNHDLAFTETNEEGINRIRSLGHYAFLLPSPIADYVANRSPCDLYRVNTTLFPQHFAFAGRKGSSLVPFVNEALSILHRTGEIDKLYRKWWSDAGDCVSDARRDVSGIRSDHMTSSHVTHSSASIITSFVYGIKLIYLITLIIHL